MATAIANPPPLRKLTEEEFMALPDDGRKYELVGGEAKVVSTGMEHGEIALILHELLVAADVRRYARMFDSGTGFRMKSGNVRSPDLSVMLRERLPDGPAPSGFGDGAPDLCVEIISPSEDRRDVISKLNEYVDSGAQQVWHIYPSTRTVLVYSLTADIRYLGLDDDLDGGDLLPGLSFKVARLFEVG